MRRYPDPTRQYPIPGFADYYITTTGVVWSHKRGAPKRIKHFVTPAGYVAVALVHNGVPDRPHLHRLLALTFLPNPKGLPKAGHKDLNPLNNDLSNLEWCLHQKTMDRSAALYGATEPLATIPAMPT